MAGEVSGRTAVIETAVPVIPSRVDIRAGGAQSRAAVLPAAGARCPAGSSVGCGGGVSVRGSKDTVAAPNIAGTTKAKNPARDEAKVAVAIAEGVTAALTGPDGSRRTRRGE